VLKNVLSAVDPERTSLKNACPFGGGDRDDTCASWGNLGGVGRGRMKRTLGRRKGDDVIKTQTIALPVY